MILEAKKLIKVVKNNEVDMPKVVEHEERVLGAVLTERDAFADVVDILKPSCFFREANQLIYEAIFTLFSENESIDTITVVHQLRKNKTLKKVGGPQYVAYLASTVASALHVEDHAKAIKEQSMRREAIKFSLRMNEAARDLSISTDLLFDRMEQELFQISEAKISKTPVGIGVALERTEKRMLLKRQKGTGVTGVPTGFSELDNILRGWQKSEFTVVAARPGMGKTALLLSSLRNVGIDHEIPVAIFSLEMAEAQLIDRLLAAETGITGEKIATGILSDEEMGLFLAKKTLIGGAPIYIDDTSALSLFEFRAKCRRLKFQKNIQAVFIDYLQLMVAGEGKGKIFNREQEISAISRGLKAVANELDIAVIAACQLSRAVEIRGGDRRPQLSDIRESGAIEQDADVVLFPYRKSYYGFECDESGEDIRDLAEIIIAKHRNGPTGKIYLTFDAGTTKFSERPYEY